MSKNAQRQFLAGAVIGAAAVYLMTRQTPPAGPVAPGTFPTTPAGKLPAVNGQFSRNPKWYGNYGISGQFSRNPKWYGNYGVGAYPLSPQRLHRPLAPPANFFI